MRSGGKWPRACSRAPPRGPACPPRPAESALACRVGPARVGPACNSQFGSARKTSRSSGPSTQTQSATALLDVDLSLSMPMRDNFLAAKKVAIALQSLISGQFPRDYLGHRRLLRGGTGDPCRRSCPRSRGTSSTGRTCSTPCCSRGGCSPRHTGTKQIIMITDGEPTAHLLRTARSSSATRRCRPTVEATLQEVAALHPGPHPRSTRSCWTPPGTCGDFVEKITQINRGRAFFTTPDTLGDYVLVDFIEHRRQQAHRHSPRGVIGRSPSSPAGVALPAVGRFARSQKIPLASDRRDGA